MLIKHQCLEVLGQRMASFQSCKWNGKGSVIEMAEAGLYFEEKSNRTLCFDCGVILHVKQHDNPLILHAQKSPFCDFIMREKGPCFMKAAIENCGTWDELSDEQQRFFLWTSLERNPQADKNLATLNGRPSVPPESSECAYSYQHSFGTPVRPNEFALHNSSDLALQLRLSLSVQPEEPSRSQYVCQRCRRRLSACCVYERGDFDGCDIMAGHMYCGTCHENCPCGISTCQRVRYA